MVSVKYSRKKVVVIISERIRVLREQAGITQIELARQLHITRSSVNAWEQGISVPSTQLLVELADTFSVSTDYLLGIDRTASVGVEGLTQKDVELVNHLISYLREQHRGSAE